MPLVVTALFLLLGIGLKRKWSRRFLITGVALFLFFSNEFIANEIMSRWEVPPTLFDSIQRPYTYGILLTGVMYNDRYPADRSYFQHGADRVMHTVQLYKKGLIKHIIVSGGTGRVLTESRREADDVYKVLLLTGIPAGDITLERNSRNTHESAVAVSEILKHGGGDALLITSAFHMRRSVACFKKCGVQVTAFSTDFYTHPRYFTPDSWLVPRPEAWTIWHKMVKEWTGMAAYRLAGYI